MAILLIDNNDSFTYNLVQLIEQSGFECEVINDDFFNNSEEIIDHKIENYQNIMFSPGPGLPSEARGMSYVLSNFSDRNILGICLGHQAIAEYFGAELRNHKLPFHGIKSTARVINRSKLLKDLPDHFKIGRYHSWYVGIDKFPNCLEINCISEDGTIMGFSHKTLNIYGLQFHPESYLSEFGIEIIKNFMTLAK